MANQMAILQDVDKCIRCNGCVVACKRTWGMTVIQNGDHRVSADNRMVVKSQKRIDMGPFVRFSCWHCENPPCAGRCPNGAIKKQPNGAVSVDFSKCKPDEGDCIRQCVADCQRGGYPKVGQGNVAKDLKAFKCTLCAGKAGSDADIVAAGGSVADGLPTQSTAAEYGAVPELKHWPACAYTCPAKALTFDTRANIVAKLTKMQADAKAAGTAFSHLGDGAMFWVSTKYSLVPPKADPFVEDHLTPMVSGALSSPLVKAAIVPTLVVGGLMALSARRVENEKEAELAMEGEATR